MLTHGTIIQTIIIVLWLAVLEYIYYGILDANIALK